MEYTYLLSGEGNKKQTDYNQSENNKPTKVRLSPQYRKLVIREINKVLDDYRIYGEEWNIEIFIDLIKDNLSRNAAIELIKRLEQTFISEWND